MAFRYTDAGGEEYSLADRNLSKRIDAYKTLCVNAIMVAKSHCDLGLRREIIDMDMVFWRKWEEYLKEEEGLYRELLKDELNHEIRCNTTELMKIISENPPLPKSESLSHKIIHSYNTR